MRKILSTRKEFDEALRKALPWFFTLVLIGTFLVAMQGYFNHNAFRVGDWLINYQGGPVRRGLIGELIYQLSRLSQINPGIWVVALQMLFYGVFLVYSCKLLKAQKDLIPFVLLLVSPFIFMYQINDHQGGFRKEIIYIALLTLVVWWAGAREEKVFEKLFYLVLAIYPLVIASHEVLVLFIPYLLVAYLSVIKMSRAKYLVLAALLIPSLLSFMAAIYYSGTAQHVAGIFSSLSQLGYEVSGGAIEYLGVDLRSSMGEVKSYATIGTFLAIVPTLALAVVAYLPVKKKLKIITANKINMMLVLSSIAGTVVLLFVAYDWGRFIYIHLVSIFLLSLLKGHNNESEGDLEQTFRVKKSVVIFLVLYSTIWQLHHYDIFSMITRINAISSVVLLVFFARYKLQVKGGGNAPLSDAGHDGK